MAWNTQRLQQLLDRRIREGEQLDLEALGQIGPVATSHINFRGVLHFPVAEFGPQLFLKPTSTALAA